MSVANDLSFMSTHFLGCEFMCYHATHGEYTYAAIYNTNNAHSLASLNSVITGSCTHNMSQHKKGSIMHSFMYSHVYTHTLKRQLWQSMEMLHLLLLVFYSPSNAGELVIATFPGFLLIINNLIWCYVCDQFKC